MIRKAHRIGGVPLPQLAVSLVFALFSFVVSHMSASANDADVSTHVDLNEWSFLDQGAVSLKDGWLVYRDQILPVTEMMDATCKGLTPLTQKLPDDVTTPDIWGPALTTKLESGHGSATYCIELGLPDSEQFYAVRMGSVRSASAIYAVFKGASGDITVSRLHQNGDPRMPDGHRINNPMPPLLTLPHGAQQMALIVQVQNDIHKQGGLIEVPVVDLRWRLLARDNRETALPSALVIVLFTIALGAIIVGMRYERARGHNIFAFLAFASGVRVLFVSDIIWDYFPSFPLDRKYDLEYLSFFLIAPAYYAFIAHLFRGKRVLKADYIVYGISAFLVFFTICITPFLAPGTITLIREPMQLLWLVIGVVVTKTLYSTVFDNPRQYQEVLVVILAAFSILIYESLSALGVIAASGEWSQVLLLFVMLMHTKAFVTNSRRIEQERDALTARLQEANDVLKKRAVSLDLALMRAEEASKAKSEFLATISHELRTPLNAIIGFSELMEREVFGELGSSHYKGYAKDINESGANLLQLVDDILDLSRIEAGKDELEENAVDLRSLVSSVLNLMKLQAENQKVSCKSDIARDFSMLRADERKVRQVLVNLVNNALKFNVPGGEVTVRAWADVNGLHVSVKDTGIGIAKEDIPIVLTRFGQADSQLSRKYTGVGIGLPLSIALMQQHGGDLTIDSELKIGTTVTLHFPADRICS